MRQETTCLFLIALPALMVGNELINNNAFISIIQVQSASPMLHLLDSFINSFIHCTEINLSRLCFATICSTQCRTQP